jgi:hypothetical protein
MVIEGVNVNPMCLYCYVVQTDTLPEILVILILKSNYSIFSKKPP